MQNNTSKFYVTTYHFKLAGNVFMSKSEILVGQKYFQYTKVLFSKPNRYTIWFGKQNKGSCSVI